MIRGVLIGVTWGILLTIVLIRWTEGGRPLDDVYTNPLGQGDQ
jgi:hypothetical protein